MINIFFLYSGVLCVLFARFVGFDPADSSFRDWCIAGLEKCGLTMSRVAYARRTDVTELVLPSQGVRRSQASVPRP